MRYLFLYGSCTGRLLFVYYLILMKIVANGILQTHILNSENDDYKNGLLSDSSNNNNKKKNNNPFGDPPDSMLNVGTLIDRVNVSSNGNANLLENPKLNASLIDALLRQCLRIECYSDYMVVYLERKYLLQFGVTKEAQISFSEFDQSCTPSKKVTNQTHFVLVTFYSMCETTSVTSSSSEVITYNNMVTFRLHSKLKVLSSPDEPQLLLTSFSSSLPTTPLNQTAQVGVFATITQKFSCPIYLNKRSPSSIFNNLYDNADYDVIINDNNGETDPQSSQQGSDSVNSRLAEKRQDLTSNSNYTFRLQLYDTETFMNMNQQPWVKYPKEVNEKQRIYVQITLNSAYEDDDLKALAKDCYFSQDSDPFKEPRHMLLTSGCPAVSSVTVYHNRLPNGQTSRLSIQAGFFFDRNFMFLHCKVTLCSIEGNRESERFEKCPSNTFCSETRIQQTGHVIANPIHSYVSSGPIRPIVQSLEVNNKFDGRRQPPVIRNDDSSLTVTCPPCPSVPAASNGAGQQAPQQVIVTNGMDTMTVLGVALASFVVGVLLMGGLCYVHKITEPKKCPVNRKTERDLSSSVDTCSTEPTAATPMTQTTTTLSSRLSLSRCLEGETDDLHHHDSNVAKPANNHSNACAARLHQNGAVANGDKANHLRNNNHRCPDYHNNFLEQYT